MHRGGDTLIVGWQLPGVRGVRAVACHLDDESAVIRFGSNLIDTSLPESFSLWGSLGSPVNNKGYVEAGQKCYCFGPSVVP